MEFTHDRWISHTVDQYCTQCLHAIRSSWKIMIQKENSTFSHRPFFAQYILHHPFPGNLLSGRSHFIPKSIAAAQKVGMLFSASWFIAGLYKHGSILTSTGGKGWKHDPHLIHFHCHVTMNSDEMQIFSMVIFQLNISYIGGLVQDCSNSSALAMELLQSCTKPSISFFTSAHIGSVCTFCVLCALIRPEYDPKCKEWPWLWFKKSHPLMKCYW